MYFVIQILIYASQLELLSEISTEDAEKIACYTLTLSAKKCTTPYAEDAAMFYTSI